ncbi:MAG: class I SAM-dependent methyltransferase [Patescibacteria group bacterium]|nr:class I SAM-dependent methyltransferase [Patescibacteria group bacterium]
MRKFQETREIIFYAQKYISGKTLDLGAGSAKYREIIKQKAFEYITFDMIPGKNIDVVGDALNLPFRAGTFDTIISTQVLEHVEKPWIMIKEIHRVLKPGGICILTAPFLTPYHADPHDYFRYTEEGLEFLFKNEGFEIIECSSYGQPFTAFSEFIRFSWFNPYKKRKRGQWKIIRFIFNVANFLNRFTKNQIIYAGVYIVAKKKK